MDDFVDDLIREQGNKNGLLLEILVSGYESWDYVIAVEGVDDAKFYYDFVGDFCPSLSFCLLQCGGKSAVLAFKQAVTDYAWVNPPKFRFLCDKDFDDYMKVAEEGVWYTDRYSIESYISDAGYVAYSIQKLSLKPIPSYVRVEFLKKYERVFWRMVSDVRVYCAFMCELRASGEHPLFDDFGIEHLFDVACQGMPRRRGLLGKARAILKVRNNIVFADVVRRTRQFDMREPHRWLRGKLALQIARKSYEIAKNASDLSLRQILPAGSFLGGAAFASAAAYWKELPGLAAYVSGE